MKKRSFYVSPKPIWNEATYEQFCERMAQTGDKLPRHTGSRWVDEEVKQLNELLDQGATQLELAAALPIVVGRKSASAAGALLCRSLGR